MYKEMSQADIYIYRGDHDEQLVELVWDDDGQPYDLTDIARADLTATVGGKKVLNLSTTDRSITVLDRTKGQLLLNFTPALTQQMTWRQAKYDLQLISKTKRVKTRLEGTLYLEHDITT